MIFLFVHTCFRHSDCEAKHRKLPFVGSLDRLAEVREYFMYNGESKAGSAVGMRDIRLVKPFKQMRQVLLRNVPRVHHGDDRVRAVV